MTTWIAFAETDQEHLESNQIYLLVLHILVYFADLVRYQLANACPHRLNQDLLLWNFLLEQL